MQRLDNDYKMRWSEAPSLKGLPSDYMREMFYQSADGGSQPAGCVGDDLRYDQCKHNFCGHLIIHIGIWICPRVIYDLPFLDEAQAQDLGRKCH